MTRERETRRWWLFRRKRTPEEKTISFFDRPANEVVRDLSERIFIKGVPKRDLPQGTPMAITVMTEEGIEKFKITLAEPYAGNDANRIWKKSRSEVLKDLEPGTVVVFSYRDGILPFISTQGADNILIRELQNTGTGDRVVNPTNVAKVLGLSHGDSGKLNFTSGDELKFTR